MATETRHKIIQLTAENIKKLKAVSISLSDGVTVVAGDNAQGKSSLLDAIMFLFMGKRHPDPKLLRTGEKKGFVEAETEDLILKRTITEGGGGSLTIKPKEGRGSFNSPQQFLDEITRRVCFDPMAFLNLKAAEQAARLRDLVGLDFTEIDADIKGYYEERTEVNREYKVHASIVESMPYDETATEEQDPAPVRLKLGEINQMRCSADSARKELTRLESENTRLEDQQEDLERTITRLQEDLEEAQKHLAGVKDELDQKVQEIAREKIKVKAMEEQIPNPEELYAKLEAIKTHNLNVMNTRARAERAAERDKARRRADELTRMMEKLEQSKEKALKEAKFPIEGLSFSADGVLFNGEPLEQSSSAEQLRVSVAISAAMNPEMPVMIVKDGSLLDKNSMRLLCSLAKEHDLQVVVERIERDEFVSVIIEDGEITLKNPIPDAANSSSNQSAFNLES